MSESTGRIATGGMGSFLCPPGHPEHSLHVETDLRRKPENRGTMSLSAAATMDWLEPATRYAAKAILDQWQPRPLTDPDVHAWVLQVLGYFRHCYRGEGEDPWNASNLRIFNDEATFTLSPDLHAGVHHIRKYYPDYQPSEEDFANAHWGKEREA